MTVARLLCAGAFLLCGACVVNEMPIDHWLPEDFTIHVADGKVVNWPAPGTQPVKLVTRNRYRGAGGGYVACYTHRAAGSAYSVGGTIYVAGQVRLSGDYAGRIFQPTGYRGKDISAAAEFKTICAEEIAACKAGECWAGGDTGGWFGIP